MAQKKKRTKKKKAQKKNTGGDPSVSRRGSEDRLLVGRQRLADLLGVTAQHVTRLASEGMPVAESGGGRGRPTMFDAVAALAWVRERQAEDTPGAAHSIRDEYLLALRDRVLQDTQARAGELVPVAHVVEQGKTLVLGLRAQLLSLARRLVDAGVPREHEPTIEREVRQMLAGISRWRTFDRREEAEVAEAVEHVADRRRLIPARELLRLLDGPEDRRPWRREADPGLRALAEHGEGIWLWGDGPQWTPERHLPPPTEEAA